MARKIHRGPQAFGRVKKLYQDRQGAIRQESGTLPVDSFPRFDMESEQTDQPKEELLVQSLEIAWRVLQEEQVLPLADLTHRIVEELMTNPNYTYRELLEVLKTDRRFSVTAGQMISLPSVADPAEVFFQRLSRMKKGKKSH